jgi:hypothetical protein
MGDTGTKRFLAGVALVWAPWVPMIVGLLYGFRGISGTKATGLAAVAGGLAESFVLWGVVTMVIGQVVAILWLAKSFSAEHGLRNIVSVISIVFSGLMLVLVCIFVGSVWLLSRHQ